MSQNIVTSPTYRTAGGSAILSGAIGILAYIVLIVAVTTRTDNALARNSPTYLMFKTHDWLAILQFLLVIPVVLALYKLSQLQLPGISKLMVRVGVGAAFFTAILLLLGIFLVVSDGLYTVPQGVFGLWMIIVCHDLKAVLSKGLIWLGRVVGLGLILAGMFFPLYAIFVSPIILQIPAVDPSDSTNFPDHFTWINEHLHYLLDVGSVLGMLLLPIWTILIGGKLLGEGRGILIH